MTEERITQKTAHCTLREHPASAEWQREVERGAISEITVSGLENYGYSEMIFSHHPEIDTGKGETVALTIRKLDGDDYSRDVRVVAVKDNQGEQARYELDQASQISLNEWLSGQNALTGQQRQEILEIATLGCDSATLNNKTPLVDDELGELDDIVDRHQKLEARQAIKQLPILERIARAREEEQSGARTR